MPQTANCDRCKRLLQVATIRKETSRPFRKSLVPKGLCPECVVTEFFYNTYPVNMLIDEAGPEILLREGVAGWSDPDVPAGLPFVAQALVGSGIMKECEMDIREIDWVRLVENWNLPVKTKKGARNPYRMGDSPRAGKGKEGELPRPGFFTQGAGYDGAGYGGLVIRTDPKTGELLVNDKPAREVDPELGASLEGLMGEWRKREKPQ